MILGDLNTMGHGVARLSPHYCCDAMRWRSLGWYEAAWWHAHVLSQVSSAGSHPLSPGRYRLRIHCFARTRSRQGWLYVYGLSELRRHEGQCRAFAKPQLFAPTSAPNAALQFRAGVMMSSNNLSTERPRTPRRTSLFPNLNPRFALSLVNLLRSDVWPTPDMSGRSCASPQLEVCLAISGACTVLTTSCLRAA